MHNTSGEDGYSKNHIFKQVYPPILKKGASDSSIQRSKLDGRVASFRHISVVWPSDVYLVKNDRYDLELIAVNFDVTSTSLHSGDARRPPIYDCIAQTMRVICTFRSSLSWGSESVGGEEGKGGGNTKGD
ncbi:hypothetical protein ACEPAH_8109 [Sanghuangporus vaninii]